MKKKIVCRAAEDNGPLFGLRRVQHILSADPFLTHKRKEKAPSLTTNHKLDLVSWCSQRLLESPTLWHRTIFSYEKLGILLGRFETASSSILFSAEGWGYGVGSFLRTQTTKFGICEGWSGCYQVRGVVGSFMQATYNTMCRSQQENASPCTAMYTQDHFMESSSVVMDWPAKSPDLNTLRESVEQPSARCLCRWASILLNWRPCLTNQCVMG